MTVSGLNGLLRVITYFFDLVTGQQVQVLVDGAGAVDVAVSRVGSASSITVDPLEPVLSTVAGDQVLKIISGGNALGLGGAEEVLLDGVGVVAKRNLDRALESVNVAVVAGTLVRLVLLHERKEFLGGPALGLEVVVVGSRGTGVHLNNISTRAYSIHNQLLTMKLIDDPPPRMCAQGTTARRPSSHSEGLE